MTNFINIQYDKQDGSVITERKIITTNIPADFISAIEVTELSDSEISDINNARTEYNEYVDLFKKNMFTFENWLEHTNQNEIKANLKYKRFKLDKTKFI